MHDLAYIVRDAHIPSITKDAKHILWHLASREGGNDASWPSTRTMSLATNISQKGVQRALNCLIEHGLIAVESGKQLGRPNRYRVTLPPGYIDEWYEKNGKRRKVGQRVPPEVGRNVPPGVGQNGGGGGTNAAPTSVTVSHIIETKRSNKNPQQKMSESVSPSEAAYGPTDAHADGAMIATRNGKRSIPQKQAVDVCYELMMPKAEGEKFWRFNQTRGWPLLSTMTLEDIAKAWRDKLLKDCPSACSDERERRRAIEEERKYREMLRKREAEEGA